TFLGTADAGSIPAALRCGILAHLPAGLSSDFPGNDPDRYPAGKGAGNIPEILKAYSVREGEKFVTLEPHLMEFSGLQGLEKDGASMLRYEYTFDNNRQAFDFAVGCLNEIIGSL
ncbi:MAG: hypothetical protein IKU10_00680, partial [Clostridia bacterium]|nr:hypothetical protein [Clostridia bacterium]